MKCDVCEKADCELVVWAGASLCEACEVAVKERVNEYHASGKPVNIPHIARALWRARNNPQTILVRDIPGDLKNAAQAKGNLREVIIAALRAYLASD
jgi:hypothetical protein